MLLDRFIPAYHFNEVRTIVVHAPAPRLFQAIKELTPADITLFRALPARLASHDRPHLAAGWPLLQQVLRSGFVLLADAPNRELGQPGGR